MRRDELREKAYEGSYMIYNLFEDDKELKLMRSTISIDFLERFRLGVSYYITGNWSKSRSILQEALKIKG